MEFEQNHEMTLPGNVKKMYRNRLDGIYPDNDVTGDVEVKSLEENDGDENFWIRKVDAPLQVRKNILDFISVYRGVFTEKFYYTDGQLVIELTGPDTLSKYVSFKETIIAEQVDDTSVKFTRFCEGTNNIRKYVPVIASYMKDAIALSVEKSIKRQRFNYLEEEAKLSV